MKKFICIIILLFVSAAVWADPTPPPILPDGSTPSAPIENGLLALVAGGIALGLRKWKKNC